MSSLSSTYLMVTNCYILLYHMLSEKAICFFLIFICIIALNAIHPRLTAGMNLESMLFYFLRFIR